MVIQQQKKFKILLIGDNCVDEYQYGIVDRISPEAPVPVFRPINNESKPGMAGNVKENLEALGCEVDYWHGDTSVKTRLVDRRSGQHIVRIDKDVISQSLIVNNSVPLNYDAIVISDYNKGTVSYELIETLREMFTGPIFVDTKKTDLARLEGCIVKINSLENSLIKTACTDLIVTLGKHGARYKEKTYTTITDIEVIDVCGAGDTFLSALAYEYLNSSNMDKAIEFANSAAEITVQHSGVYAPKLKEIKWHN